MTCRHTKGDPQCTTWSYSVAPATPDAANFTVEAVERLGAHLVLKVKYPNCRACTYEGNKVMVFLNASETQALRWRKIDPHFRDPKKPLLATEAPAPAARFPASAEGWLDALAYARSKPGGSR